MNTMVDNIIDNLQVGDYINFEGERQEITALDSYNCTLKDEQGDEYEYDWGAISEELEYQIYEERNDSLLMAILGK